MRRYDVCLRRRNILGPSSKEQLTYLVSDLTALAIVRILVQPFQSSPRLWVIFSATYRAIRGFDWLAVRPNCFWASCSTCRTSVQNVYAGILRNYYRTRRNDLR